MALPKLVVELAAKIREYMADLDKAATATEASAARIERADKTMVDAARGVASGQADVAETAVQVASRMGPMGGAVAAAAAVVAGYAVVSYKAAQENTALVRALALSGNQAGVTAGQLQGMAAAASQVVGTHGQAAQAIGLMVSGGKVAGENLQALTVTALNASRTLGIGVQETVKHYEALADSPAKASAKLNQAMGYLNAETYRRIQALEEMGRKDEAAALAQQTYARGVDDATKKVEASLGTLQRGWRNVGEAAGKAWDWMLGLGRKDDVQDSMAGLRQQLDVKERQLRAGFASTGGGAAVGMRGMSDDRRGQLEAEAEGLREQIRLIGRAGATAAQNAAASAKYQQESIEWSAKAAAAEERLKSNATKRADAIAEADKRLAQGYITQTARNNLVADAEQRYADKATKGAKAASDEYGRLGAEIQKQLDLANQQLVVGRQLTASEKFRIDTLSKIDEALRKQNITQAQATQLVRDMTIAEAARQAVEDKAKRIKIDQALFAQQVQNMEDEAAYNVARSKAWEQSQLALVGYNQSVQDQIDLTQVELGLAGQTQQSRDLALTYYRIALELKKQIRAIDESEGYDSEADREVARARARATAAKARLNAETQSQVSEWNRVFDQVENGLTDALMRGFEAGKSMFANLRDYAANMFKTLVLRPIVSAIVSPVAGAITGALGLSGAANAETGGGSLLGTAGTLSSAYNAINGGITNSITAGFNNLASSRVGQSLGLSVEAAGPSLPGMPAPTQLTSFGQTASSWATTIGNTMAGIALGSMAKSLISGGYSAGKGMDTFQNIGVAVGSAIPIGGPLVGAIIGAGAGVFNRAFGRKLKDQGIQGEFGGEAGFTGENYKFYKGGWFRSDKTKTSPLDADMQSGLANQFKAIQLQTALMATALGDTGQSVADFTSSIKLSFNGLTEAQIGEKLTETFAGVSDDMAQGVLMSMARAEVSSEAIAAARAAGNAGLSTITSSVADMLDQSAGKTGELLSRFFGNVMGQAQKLIADETAAAGYLAVFVKEGETASDTLTRLSTSLTTINATWDALGFTLDEVSLKGAAASSSFIDLMGGLENFKAATSGYYSNFYTEAERADYATSQLTKQLADLGQTMPTTRDGFRALVQAAEAAGNDALLAGLLNLQDEFAALVPAAEDATAAMTSVVSGLKSETTRLQRELLVASGGDVRGFDTAGMDASSVAIYDYNQSLRDQISAANAATKANEAATQASEAAAEAAATAAQRAAEEAQRAADTYANALRDAQDYIAGVAKTVGEWVDAQNANTTNPTNNLASARAAFAAQMAFARGGDRDAINGITGYADRLLQAGSERLGYIQQQQLLAQTKAQLIDLPKQLTPEQFIVDGLVPPISAVPVPIVAGLDGITSTLVLTHTGIVDALQSGFAGMDADNNGLLTITEFKTGMAGKASDAELAFWFAKLDVSGDGTISQLELLNDGIAGVATAVRTGFAGMDADNNGLLTITEFKSGMAGKASDTELAFWFAKLDTNGDGALSQLELVATGQTDIVAALRAGFAAMDADNNGLLTIAEFKAGMAGKATNSELDYWFAVLDANGDGQLSKLEAIKTNTSNASGSFDPNDPLRSVFQAIKDSTFTSAFYLQDASNKLNVIQHYQIATADRLLDVMKGGHSFLVRSAGGGGNWYANGGAFVGGVQAFATGGAFTNGIFNRPTMAPMALFGEAGPEAIMPLQRGPDGRLGVTAQVQMPDWSQYGRSDNSALVAEIKRLNDRLARIEAATTAAAVHSADSADSLRNIKNNGLEVFNDPATPLVTEAAP